jgi:cell division protein FtsL
MARFISLVWVVLMVGLTVGLFKIKYSVQQIEAGIAEANQRIAQLQDEYEVLEAEWQHQNRPERLERLAKAYLDIKSDRGTLVTSLRGLPERPASLDLEPASQDPAFTTAPQQLVEQFQSREPVLLSPQGASGLGAAGDPLGSLISGLED